MAEIDKLTVSVEADTKPLEASLVRAEKTTEQAGKRLGSNLAKSFDKDFDRSLSNGVNRLGMSLFKVGQQGKSLSSSLDGILGSVTNSVTQSIFQSHILSPLKDMVFGGLFGRAGGGSVSPGQSYMVGERGPELFTPKTTGSIGQVPDSLSNGQTQNINITMNIQSDSPDHFKRSQGQIMASMSNQLRNRL
jgi:phage-related minor tail protein